MGILDNIFGRSKTTEYSQDTKSKSESEQRTQVHPMLQKLGKQMLMQASDIAATPYLPNRGVRVAGFSPGQKGAMDMANQMLASMGFAPQDFLGGLPEEETMGGVTGYTTGDLYDQILAASDPEGIYASLMSDPVFTKKMFQQPKQPAAAPSAAPQGYDRDLLLLDAKYQNDPRWGADRFSGREAMTDGSQWRREYGYAKDRLNQKYGM